MTLMQITTMTATIMKNKHLDEKKIILGLSGGVDSTAAALILQRKGYEVTGLYFNVLGKDCLNYERNIEEGRQKAKKAAQQMGIKLIYKDMSEAFADTVISNFCDEYMHGRTPNPCVICNPLIKFKALTEAADEEGAAYIATGHYADTWKDPESGIWYIKKAANESKDQSYMLYRLEQDVISRLILPLNSYTDKEEIRQIVRAAGIMNSEAKDSQEICFIDAEDNYMDFLERRGFKAAEGDFVGSEGNVLGRHKGITAYTIGQRKGLGIALGYPAFVTGIDPDTNTVELGSNQELFTKTVRCTGIKLCKQEDEAFAHHEISAKIRYAAKPARALLTYGADGTAEIEFEQPQRAPTPGQSVVFYRGDLVIGGGFIR